MAARMGLWSFLVGLSASLAVSAQAQSLNAPQAQAAALEPAMVAALYLESVAHAAQVPDSAASSASAAPGTAAERHRVWQGRWRTVLGSAVALGGAVGLASMGRSKYCVANEFDFNKTAPRVVGGVATGFGLGLTIAGLTRLYSVPSEVRAGLRMSRGRRVGMAFATLGATALSIAAVGAAALPDVARCGTT